MEKRTLLKENSQSVISEILKKYQLYEDADIEWEKMGKGKLPNETILLRTSFDLKENKISDQEAFSILKNNLKISETQAHNLLLDLKATILPLIDIISINEEDKETEDTSKNLEKKSYVETSEATQEEVNKNLKTLNENNKIRKNFPKKPAIEKTISQKKSEFDKYRESLE